MRWMQKSADGTLGAICLLGIMPSLWASEAELTLGATGTILPVPTWQNEQGIEVNSLEFTFDGKLAGHAERDIDSKPFAIKLVQAPSYPATVTLVLPANCRIGSTNTDDEHLSMVVDGKALKGNTSLSIRSDATQTYALRFDSAGKYGDKSGTVACAKKGALRLSY